MTSSRSSTDAVKKTRRVERPSELTMVRISNPVKPGNEMSRIAMSGTKRRIASMQFGPSLQDATTLKPLSALSAYVKPCRTTGWRSAITTLVQRIGGPQHLPHPHLNKPRAPTEFPLPPPPVPIFSEARLYTAAQQFPGAPTYNRRYIGISGITI